MYEVLTTLFAFPALGHDVNVDYRTHPRDLLAQKLSLFAPRSELSLWARKHRVNLNERTDLATTAVRARLSTFHSHARGLGDRHVCI